MDRGLYIAASGMLAEMARQDLLANDLANSTTPGYKGDRAAQRSFGEMMLANTRTGQTVGALGSGSAIVEQVTDLRGAPLKDTGEPLDFAIAGEGFFAVQTPQGVRYTRNGSFQTGANGGLVDQLGNPVLGRNGQPLRVAADGTVAANDVGVYAVANARKAGEGLFTGNGGGQATGEVKQGAIEASGVDAARTMVDMMASLRAYEAGQKVLTTIDSTLEKAASQIGRT
jgi:flagellar basal-body rod protein FlgG